jgi:hypothetical protein
MLGAQHTAVFGWQGPGELGLEVRGHGQLDRVRIGGREATARAAGASSEGGARQ